MAERKCLFVEVEAWEEERFRSRCGDCHGMIARTEALQDVALEDQAGVTILSTRIYSRVDAEALDRFPDLKLIATRSTGVDHIDLDVCRQRGITVCNVPTYGANTVAEHTFALILALTRRVHKAYEQTIRCRFTIEGLRGIDLRDRTIGVIGTGAIGTHVVRIALGFQMRVLAYDICPIGHMADALGFHYVPIETLLAESDIVTLHCPYLPATHHLMSAERLAMMKPRAILINTARGALVDTPALVAALKEGRLGGAGLDVLEDEVAIREEGELLACRYDLGSLATLVHNNILLQMDNVIITPHMAFNSEEALNKILDTTVSNVAMFLEGHPQNVVAGPAA